MGFREGMQLGLFKGASGSQREHAGWLMVGSGLVGTLQERSVFSHSSCPPWPHYAGIAPLFKNFQGS